MFSRYVPFAFVLLALSLPSHAYYGRHSAEAILTYQAVADVPLAGEPTVESLNNPNGRTRMAADSAVTPFAHNLAKLLQAALRDHDHLQDLRDGGH